MSYLIILRGPMGSGKTEDSDTLDLDVNANDPIENLDKVLRKKMLLLNYIMETLIQLIRNGLRNFRQEDSQYYQLSSRLGWRHILSDLQKGLIKEIGMTCNIIIRNFTMSISLNIEH
jgi:hypothetical protein